MNRTIALVLLALALPLTGLCQGEGAPAQAPEGGEDAAEGEGQVVVMRAVWPDGDLTNTAFRVFEDRAMRNMVDVFPAPGGNAMAVLRPGEYFVMAVVDVNGNNKPDTGDGFGFHGVSDLSAESQPEPMKVEEGKLNTTAISILMTRAEDGRLTPLPSALERTTGTLSGELKGVSGAGKSILLALPVGMQTRPVVTVVDEDGSFKLEVPAGAHTLVALTDADDSGTVTVGDVLATRGVAGGEPVSVGADADTAVEPMEIGGDHAVPEDLPPIVAGRVTGAQIPEGGRAVVAFCTDQALRNEAFSVVARPDGSYAAVPEAGTYYLRATIDEADDGRLGVGDMLGF
ncbi:MAG: hypothetical protein ACOC7J_04820, partial [Armatimonadota bacterium]